MATSSLVLGTLVLVAAGCAAWLFRRRGRSPGRVSGTNAASSVDASGTVDAVAQDGYAPAGEIPVSTDLLPDALPHRLYALAFEQPMLARPPAAPGSVHAEVAAAAADLLSRIDTQRRYTPRRPLLLPQLMRTINDPSASAQAIAAIIGQDPALAANLLRIAGSPLYRVQSKPVDSIDRAVAMVGTEGLRQIISAALVQPVMGSGSGAFAGFPGTMWEHALMSAVAAADHAKLVERGDAFAAQLGGLLQGLAAIIVVQVVRDQYAKRPGVAPQVGVAVALLDRWTDPVARRIAAKWELSDAIAQALAEQGAAAPKQGALARSLCFGRSAATLAMLCARDAVAEHDALQALHLIEGRGGTAVDGIWRRLRREVDAQEAG